MTAMAILTDVTLCTGCGRCVDACKEANHDGPDVAHAWTRDPSGLTETRRTTLLAAPSGRAVRYHCRHCLDPSCVQACIVGALIRTPTGAVTYDPTTCIGCRYCMVACPFGLVRYEWGEAVPEVVKCSLCHDAVSGWQREPACTAACPEHATIYGEREALLREAHRRIEASPSRYVDHVWGEEELGGTSVLYVSDVDLTEAGWPARLGDGRGPELTRTAMHAVPPVFVGVGATMLGLSWIIGRRQKRAAEERASAPPPAAEAEAPQPPPDGDEKGGER